MKTLNDASVTFLSSYLITCVDPEPFQTPLKMTSSTSFHWNYKLDPPLERRTAPGKSWTHTPLNLETYRSSLQLSTPLLIKLRTKKRCQNFFLSVLPGLHWRKFLDPDIDNIPYKGHLAYILMQLCKQY